MLHLIIDQSSYQFPSQTTQTNSTEISEKVASFMEESVTQGKINSQESETFKSQITPHENLFLEEDKNKIIRNIAVFAKIFFEVIVQNYPLFLQKIFEIRDREKSLIFKTFAQFLEYISVRNWGLMIKGGVSYLKFDLKDQKEKILSQLEILKDATSTITCKLLPQYITALTAYGVALKTLKDERSLMRQPKEIAFDTFLNRNSFEKIGAVLVLGCSPSLDPTSTLAPTPTFMDLYHDILKTHELFFYLIESFEEIQTMIGKVKSSISLPIDLLVFAAHGSSEELAMSQDPKKTITFDTVSQIDFSGLDEKASILLYSCETGSGKIPQEMADRSGKLVFAFKEETRANALGLKNVKPFIPLVKRGSGPVSFVPRSNI